jgi:hypothetical protein
MYQLEWTIPDKVFYIKYWDSLTLDELMEATTLIKEQYLDNHEGPIHMMADLSELQDFPKRVNELHKAMDLFARHPSMGWVILIGFRNPVVNFLASLLTQVTNLNMKTESSQERALDILKRVDATLT